MTIKELPKHIAVIMDGNGRWAKERSHSRIWGHVRGASVVSKIVEEADDLGIQALTMYAFSTENWSRPFKEVSSLFLLLKKFLKRERTKIIKNNIKFNIIGDISKLPESTQDLIQNLKEETSNNSGLKLTFAFGYGGRSELIRSFNKFISENPGKKIDEKIFSKYLDTTDLPEVDLLIRTGGDQRISNFLLWQIAYAELYFTEVKWPNFTKDQFRKIVYIISHRERRFGSVNTQSSLTESEKLSLKYSNSFKE